MLTGHTSWAQIGIPIDIDQSDEEVMAEVDRSIDVSKTSFIKNKTGAIRPRFSFENWQEREDSNPRPLVLETSALARLSYAPMP